MDNLKLTKEEKDLLDSINVEELETRLEMKPNWIKAHDPNEIGAVIIIGA